MKKIAHRINTIKQLEQVPTEYGTEIDVRSQGERLILHHDPFEEGEDLIEWLKIFNHGTLILNVKEEGLEVRLLQLMAEHGIADFFFLDQSFPFLIRTASIGESRSAVRVSEFEGLTCARALAGKVDWAWVDCFNRFPLDQSQADELKVMNYRLCLVSPELQGRVDPSEIDAIRLQLDALQLSFDAVCTKVPDLW